MFLCCKQQTNRAKRWGIGALFLGIFLLFSGCLQSFENNPVALTLKSGREYLDLSDEQLSALFDEFDTTLQPDDLGTVSVQQQATFDRFLDRVQESELLAYEKTVLYLEQRPEYPTELETFLENSTLYVVEQGKQYVAVDYVTDQKVLHTSKADYLIDMKQNTKAEVEIPASFSRDTMYYLSTHAALSLVAVEKEVIENEQYTVYHVEEDQMRVKWYFDSAQNLVLRTFYLDNIPTAIRYTHFTLEPKLEDDLFLLPENGTETTKGEAESSTAEKPVSSSSSASINPSSAVSSSATQERPAQQPPATSAASESPAAQPEVPPATTLPPVSSLQESSCEESSQASKPQKDPHYVPDYSDNKQIPPKNHEPNTEIPPNYPRTVVPLPRNFTPDKVEDIILNGTRTITISGPISGSLFANSDYFAGALNATTNLTDSEQYDEVGGYTYRMFRGDRDGWNFYVEIAQSHVTNQCYLTIRATAAR